MKRDDLFKSESFLQEESVNLQRRDFFKILGGGILILAQPWNFLDVEAIPAALQGRSLTKDYNAFLHIAEDGTVTCFT